MKSLSLFVGVLAVALPTVTALAQTTTTYTGNGATGFGGAVGGGSLAITGNVSTGMLTVSFTPATGAPFNDDLVVYIDSVTGGYTNNSTFTDTADGGRTAVSGYTSSTGNHTLATFAGGFAADYALSIESGYFSLFQLTTANGGTNGPNNFLFVNGTGQTGSPYSLTFPASNIGLTLTNTSSFKIEGTYISTTAYRSNETIGTSVTAVDPTVPGTAPNAGTTGTVTFATFNTFTMAPEPSTYVCMGIGALGLLALNRRRSRGV